MNNSDIVNKFGAEFVVNADTFIMGIHHNFGEHIGQKFSGYNKVLDACLGAGFTTLHIARNAQHVIAVDISEEHVLLAKENTLRAGLSNKITFIHGDITSSEVLDQIQDIDGAFLDPDWAAEGDMKTIHVTKLSQMVPAGDLLFNLISEKTKNIAYRLPKEFDLNELQFLPEHSIESFVMESKLKFYCAYFGKLTGSRPQEEFTA